MPAPPRSYVDQHPITDAPADGTIYGRKDASWERVPGTPGPSGGVPEAPASTILHVRRGHDATWQPAPIQADVPLDGSQYARLNGGWARVATGLGVRQTLTLTLATGWDPSANTIDYRTVMFGTCLQISCAGGFILRVAGEELPALGNNLTDPGFLICTFPPGFRPQTQQDKICGTGDANKNIDVSRLLLLQNGELRIVVGSRTAYIFLDEIIHLS